MSGQNQFLLYTAPDGAVTVLPDGHSRRRPRRLFGEGRSPGTRTKCPRRFPAQRANRSPARRIIGPLARRIVDFRWSLPWLRSSLSEPTPLRGTQPADDLRKAIFKESELTEDSVCANLAHTVSKMEIVRAEGELVEDSDTRQQEPPFWVAACRWTRNQATSPADPMRLS